MTIGGNAQPVILSDETPVGAVAIRVYGFTVDDLDRAMIGGAATPIYLVSDAEIASGAFEIGGGAAVAMVLVDSPARTVGAKPIPVYLAGGSFDPTPPPVSDGGSATGFDWPFTYSDE